MHNKTKQMTFERNHNVQENDHFSLRYRSSFMHAYRQCCCCCCCCCFCFLSSSFLFPHSSLSSTSLGAHLSKINKWLHTLFTAVVPWHSSRCTRLIFPGWKAGGRREWGEQREITIQNGNLLPYWNTHICFWRWATRKVIGYHRPFSLLEIDNVAQLRTVSVMNYTHKWICSYSDFLPEEG